MARQYTKHPDAKRKTCTVCGRSKKEELGYWSRRDGTRFDICKECAGKKIDIKSPQTFLWIMKEADIPFIETVWVRMCQNAYQKDPYRFSPGAVMGRYISNVKNTSRYSDYRYSDTLALNQATRERREREKEFAEGDNEGEYTAINEDIELLEDIKPLEKPEPISVGSEELDITSKEKMRQAEKEPEDIKKAKALKDMIPLMGIDESEILEALTDEEKQQLALKWGESFRPSEWIKMEDMFQKYCHEYEMNVDREETLIAMCKTNINMQRCLDSGDAANAQKFSSMFDQLRKSGAFTEAQKKEEKEKYLDSVGELVAAVEREGGIIPVFDFEIEAPQDKVDLTIKDMKSYTYNLVKNEMGLGDLIESYIQKLDKEMEMNKDKSLDDGLITSREEEQDIQNDIEADNRFANLADDIAAEADEIYAQISGDD